MKELINVKEYMVGDKYVQCVNAFEFYIAMNLDKSHYSRWCKKNIVDNMFAEEDVDYSHARNGLVINQQLTNVGDRKHYLLTIDFAKKLAMTTKNETGERFRNYFIACEKQLIEERNNYSKFVTYREDARSKFSTMLDVIDENAKIEGRDVGVYEYQENADLINRVVLKCCAREFKEQNGISYQVMSIRDYLSIEQIKAIAYIQEKNTTLLEMGLPYLERLSQLTALFNRKFKPQIRNELLQAG